mmetsp:Transcript_23413/g.51853  ORF Transcript_23413/g.51853 Transcript_23413/m.51853 type:complete len:109 (-) Transcript_23413:112-438(-)
MAKLSDAGATTSSSSACKSVRSGPEEGQRSSGLDGATTCTTTSTSTIGHDHHEGRSYQVDGDDARCVQTRRQCPHPSQPHSQINSLQSILVALWRISPTLTLLPPHRL